MVGDEKLITVYTCSTNHRDALREDQCADGAQFRAFVDLPLKEGSIWTRADAACLFQSPRRNARMHKILSHQFVDSRYSVWLDANIALNVPAARLVDEYLEDADIAVFRHRLRNCTYAEAARCRELGLDSPDVIDAQMRRYREAGLPEAWGLPETSVVIRRHSERIQRFNDAWWSELCRHSVRDQLAFMFAARAVGLRIKFILPTKFNHPFFSVTARPAGVEPSHKSHRT